MEDGWVERGKRGWKGRGLYKTLVYRISVASVCITSFLLQQALSGTERLLPQHPHWPKHFKMLSHRIRTSSDFNQRAYVPYSSPQSSPTSPACRILNPSKCDFPAAVPPTRQQPSRRTESQSRLPSPAQKHIHYNDERLPPLPRGQNRPGNSYEPANVARPSGQSEKPIRKVQPYQSRFRENADFSSVAGDKEAARRYQASGKGRKGFWRKLVGGN